MFGSALLITFLLCRLWDWSTSRKTGAVQLDLPAGVYATYARFVNELHEQTVVMAEISRSSFDIQL